MVLELVFVPTSERTLETLFEMVLEFSFAGKGSQKVCVPEIL